MKYLKTYESMREDFYKEIELLKKKEEELIQSTKGEVDEYMYSLTDDYSVLPSTINIFRNQMDGEIDKRTMRVDHYKWDKSTWPDISTWYNKNVRKSKETFTVESLFSIQYNLKCVYSEDGGYRAYDKKDKLDYFIEELESTIQRVKETTGLEYRLKVKMLVNTTTATAFNTINFEDWIDINYLKGELAWRQEVSTYQISKYGEDNISSTPYSELILVLEFL